MHGERGFRAEGAHTETKEDLGQGVHTPNQTYLNKSRHCFKVRLSSLASASSSVAAMLLLRERLGELGAGSSLPWTPSSPWGRVMWCQWAMA